MALYSFDGTGNDDKNDEKFDFDTNVLKFRDQYPGAAANYCEGVGTRLGLIGKVIGGLTGAGGRTRIAEMYDKLVANWQQGDRVVDIVGFSRGAALAVHFSNVVTKRGIRTEDGTVIEAHPQVRFLGLWDVVAAFGIPMNFIVDFQKINIDWDLTVGSGVQHCFHAMALNERREPFEVTRLNADRTKTNVEEIWFRGVHTDVGGGSGNDRLANIPLKWMYEKARSVGLPIPDSAIAALEGKMDESAPLHVDIPLKNGPRQVLATDKFHSTAFGKTLKVGEERTFNVDSAKHWNASGICLEAGHSYQVSVPANLQWKDGGMVCNAEGWESSQLPLLKRFTVERMEGFRRLPDANWFAVVGALNRNEETLFKIGTGTTCTPTVSSELYAFANDLPLLYGNNEGSLPLTVKRLS